MFVALWSFSGRVLAVAVSQMLALLALCVVHQLWRFFRCLLWVVGALVALWLVLVITVSQMLALVALWSCSGGSG